MKTNFVKSILTGIILLVVLTSFSSALETSSGNVVAGIWFDNLPTSNSITVNDGTNVAFNVYGLALGSSLNVKADLILQNGTVVPIADVFQSSQSFNEFGVGSQGDYTVTPAEYGGVGNQILRLTVNGVVLELDLTISAVPVNNAPVFTSVPVLTVNEGQSYSYDADGFDVDMDALTYSLSTNPLGFSINPSTGVITGTAPMVSANTNYNVVVTVTDGTAFTNQPFQVTVLDTIVGPVNNAPIITSTPILSVNENSAYTYDVDATDVDLDTLTYSIITNPGWLSINSATGVITGTSPSVSANTNYNVVVRVSDGTDFIDQTYTITVNNVGSSGGGGGGSPNNNKVVYSYQDPDQERLVAQNEGSVAPKIDLTPEVEKSWLARLIEWIINFLKRVFS